MIGKDEGRDRDEDVISLLYSWAIWGPGTAGVKPWPFNWEVLVGHLDTNTDK